MGSTMRLRIYAPLLPALLLASACEDDQIIKVQEPEVHVDVLKQRDAALVDILWVVDNSQSMVPQQESLARNFDQFISGLTVCQGTGMANDFCDFDTKKCSVSGGPCNPPNYHIGVISTDVRAQFDNGKLRRVGLCVPGMGMLPAADKYRYCQGTNNDCAHDAQDPNSDPANSNCDMNQSVGFITPTTRNGPAAFSRAVRVGTGGSGLETGIQAAAAALGRDTNRGTGQWVPAPTENDGFLRPDASLFLIFVSDEDDNSFGEPTYFYRAFETLKGAGNEGVVSVSSIVGDPDPDGQTGPVVGGCDVPNMTDVRTRAGTRYVALSMYSRGLSAEFKVCDDRRLTCDGGFSCQRPVEGLPGVCVPTSQCSTDQQCGNFQCSGDKGCITCENSSCQLKSELFLELLERNGVFGSICAPDYGVVLGSLGFEAAGLVRKFELTRSTDCTKTAPCCDDSAGACTTEAPLCVKVNGKVIANDRTNGWVYEPGSHSIFFDGAFVPNTGADISISYRAAAADSSISCETILQ